MSIIDYYGAIRYNQWMSVVVDSLVSTRVTRQIIYSARQGGIDFIFAVIDYRTMMMNALWHCSIEAACRNKHNSVNLQSPSGVSSNRSYCACTLSIT